MRYEKKAALKGAALVVFVLLCRGDFSAMEAKDDALTQQLIANARKYDELTREIAALDRKTADPGKTVRTAYEAERQNLDNDSDEFHKRQILKRGREVQALWLQQQSAAASARIWSAFAYTLFAVGQALLSVALFVRWRRSDRLLSEFSAASNAAPIATMQNGMIGKLVGFNRYKIVRQAGYCSDGLVFEALDTEQNRLVYINFRADLAQEKAVDSGDMRPAERVLIGMINMN
jgi:hypothetical protein